MTEGAYKRQGFSAVGGREAKAAKIAAILAAAGRPLKPEDDVLDLGCGSGEIAAYLARLARVSCADAIDQRTQGKDLPFYPVENTLPFADDAFDVVISNHVIEHVPDAATHLREIHRVVRPDGVLYLATPNRWWPWEVHTRMPLMHYLPPKLFSRLAIRMKRSNEDLRLLSLRSLRKRSCKLFTLATWHQKVVLDPGRYSLHLPPWGRTLISLLPRWLIETSASLHPTLICVLNPR